MDINNPLYNDINFTVSLYQRLLDIQDTPPSPEESDALLIALNELGLTQDLIEQDALSSVHGHLMHDILEISHGRFELMGLHPNVPSTVEKTLGELIIHLEQRDGFIAQFFGDAGLKTEDLHTVFTPPSTDHLVDSVNYPKLKTVYSGLLERINALLSPSPLTQSKLDVLTGALRDLEITEYLLRFFDWVNYDEVSPMEITLGELKQHMNQTFDTSIDGVEAFSACYDRVLSQPANVAGLEANFMSSMREGIKKAGDSIMEALRKVVSFFADQKKSLSERKQKVAADCEKQLEELSKLDAGDYEVDQTAVENTHTMLEKAEMPEAAAFFKNISGVPQLIQAYKSACGWFNKSSADTADADSALSEAQKAAEELTKMKVDVGDDAGSEEKAAIREEKNTLSKKAKDAFENARQKCSEALKPIAGFERIRATMKKSIKRADKVAGTEAWEL